MDRFFTARQRPPPHRGKRRPDDRRLVTTTAASSSDDVLLVQRLLRALPLPWPELSRICRSNHHQSNLLYRSDSFKFERFQPPQSHDQFDGALSQISLQDEYSVPIDLIAHSRPDTLLDTNTRWLTGKRYGQSIQIIDTYSDPRDSKTYQQPAVDNNSQNVYYTNTTRDYSLPYTDYSSATDSQPDDDNNDNDCVQCDVIARAKRVPYSRRPAGRLDRGEEEEEEEDDEDDGQLGTNHSQYSSAHKRRTRPAGSGGRRHASRKEKEEEQQRRYEEEVEEQRRYTRSTTGRKFSNSYQEQKQSQQSQFHSEQRRRTPYYYSDLISADGAGGDREAYSSISSMPPHQSATSNPADTPPPPQPLPLPPSLMSRLYETAFDCRISRSDDELEVDLVTHRSLLQSSPSTQSQLQAQSQLPVSQLQQPVTRGATSLHHHRASHQHRHHHSQRHHQHQLSSTNLQRKPEEDVEEEMIGQELSRLGLSSCPPSAPASAPLPAKFASSHRGAPPSTHHHHRHHSRLKDFRLPIKSLRSRPNDPRALEGRPDDSSSKKRDSSKSGGVTETASASGGGGVSGARPKYSSSESMATTSSSGGSLESIRSSTSDGNRSTTSSDSQASSSLSSHSSDNRHTARGRDSGGVALGPLSLPLGAVSASRSLHLQHILSPISDKSGHEQNSETSDNNRNNNSQGTPDDVTGGCTPTSVVTDQLTMSCVASETSKSSKSRRSTATHAQNRNVARLAPDAEALQAGSDSGISVECPPTLKPDASQLDLADLPFDMPKLRRRRLQQLQQAESSGNMCQSVSHDKPRRKPLSPQQPQSLDLSHLDSGSTTSVDLRDLPFDMPKLRRRAQSQQADDNSGSTTSVDLRDLPFDMPKLRRRQRMSLPITAVASSSGAASSSQSVQESDHRVSRPSLTLNLDQSASRPSCSSLNLRLELEETSSAALGEAIDVRIPLEKQGWYHGVITRLEAETLLRSHREGSYLVRNSESSKNDYSLSLKSARGFMHMRIQQCAESGKYILGQFSSPFSTIPDMIHNYTVNRLPIRGAEHMCLLHPVIEQLL